MWLGKAFRAPRISLRKPKPELQKLKSMSGKRFVSTALSPWVLLILFSLLKNPSSSVMSAVDYSLVLSAGLQRLSDCERALSP